MSQRRIGLLGGTFDPPHIGHLMVAVEVRAALGLDAVALLVAHAPWQKADRAVSTPQRRLAMAAAAAEGLPGVEAWDFEVAVDGPTYTVDTLERLRRERPEVAPTLILGADTFAGLHTWHRAADLVALADLAVVDRPGWRLPTDPSATTVGPTPTVVEVPQLDVSSSDIRRRVHDSRPIDVLCPPRVVSLVAEWGLYHGHDGS
ncbi:MAG: nicotinate-nucleotide adenylyltransferase [Microthrixaceae bacterium]